MTQYKECINLFLGAILAGYALLGLFLIVPAVLGGLGPLLTLLVIILVVLIVLFALAIIFKALAKLFKFGKY
ncbi:MULTISPECIES: hypothetical protein [Bhargavaea]|uniref:Uncharacterized protein n=1 Tax=Bhargavaea changchunensis TaxID=2134037 RepID=A0ABW2NLL9_9BACL|nr:hypothetical protein [Bhargavaea sp. CC-171006]